MSVAFENAQRIHALELLSPAESETPNERLVWRTGKRYNAHSPHGSHCRGWLRNGCCAG